MDIDFAAANKRAVKERQQRAEEAKRKRDADAKREAAAKKESERIADLVAAATEQRLAAEQAARDAADAELVS